MSFWKTPTRRSPAMVVALIALLASLAGTATAAKVLITSKDIKNGTIQPIDLSAKAKRVLKARRGPAGPPGAAGEQGSQGPQGLQGPQGPPIRFTNAYSDQVTVANGSFAFADAICPTGKQVVGGGYATENVGTALLVPTNSYPIGTGDGRSAWYVVMFNIGNQPEAFWAVAYCVNNS